MRNQYTIPPNYDNNGSLLGMFKIRNVIEAVVILIVMILISVKLPIHGTAKIYVSLLMIIPFPCLALVGLNDMSFTQFLWKVFMFLRERRVLKTPTSRDRIEREKKIAEKRRKKLREKQKMERAIAKEKRKSSVQRSSRRKGRGMTEEEDYYEE